jgi:hypothetical protein
MRRLHITCLAWCLLAGCGGSSDAASPMAAPQAEDADAARSTDAADAGVLAAVPWHGPATRPWSGILEATVTPPGREASSYLGRATASFTPGTGDTVRMVLFGTLDGVAGEAGFTLDGRLHDGAWSAAAEGVELSVDANGRLAGGGRQATQALDMSGTLDPTDARIRVDLELLEPSEQGLPAGTRFRFDYRLARALPEAPDTTEGDRADASRDEDEGTCREIRYEMRPVANIGDGTMSMLSVPVCIE